MAWKIEFDHNAAKEYKKLDKQAQYLIKDYLRKELLTANHPKDLGKPLKHESIGLWRYKLDNYKIICSIEENRLLILVLKIGKRDDVND